MKTSRKPLTMTRKAFTYNGKNLITNTETGYGLDESLACKLIDDFNQIWDELEEVQNTIGAIVLLENIRLPPLTIHHNSLHWIIYAEGEKDIPQMGIGLNFDECVRDWFIKHKSSMEPTADQLLRQVYYAHEHDENHRVDYDRLMENIESYMESIKSYFVRKGKANE